MLVFSSSVIPLISDLMVAAVVQHQNNNNTTITFSSAQVVCLFTIHILR